MGDRAAFAEIWTKMRSTLSFVIGVTRARRSQAASRHNTAALSIPAEGGEGAALSIPAERGEGAEGAEGGEGAEGAEDAERAEDAEYLASVGDRMSAVTERARRSSMHRPLRCPRIIHAIEHSPPAPQLGTSAQKSDAFAYTVAGEG